MQTEPQNLQLEFDQLMTKYNELKSQLRNADKKKDQLLQIDSQINKLNQQITIVTQNAHQISSQIEKPDSRILELQRLIQEEQCQQRIVETQYLEEIARLEQELKSKTQMIDAQKNHELEEQDLQKTVQQNSQVNDLQRYIIDKLQLIKLQYEISQLQTVNINLSAKFQQLTTQLRIQERNHEQSVKVSLRNEQQNRQKAFYISQLEKELKELNEQSQRLKKNIQQEKYHQKIIYEEKKKKKESYKRELEELEQVRNRLKRDIDIREKEKQLERDKLVNESNKLKQQKDALDTLDNDYNILTKNSFELDMKIQELKKKLILLKQEENKPQKNHKKQNYKQEISMLERQIQYLESQIERERKKYHEIVQVRSTYVEKTELNKLEDQYNKLTQQFKPYDDEKTKNQKLLKQNSFLKKKIEYLKNVEEQQTRQKKTLIEQIKTKTKNLIQDKQYYEKNIQHNQLKLNQYLKQFPNHQLEKQLKKKAKKHHESQETQKIEQNSNYATQSSISNHVVIDGEQIKKKKKKRNQGKKTEKNHESEEQTFDSTLILIPEPTSKGPQLYKNKTVQSAIFIAVIIVSLILFSVFN